MSSDRNIPGGSDVDPTTQPSSSTTNIDNNNNIDDTVNITNALLSSPDAHAAALAMVAAAASRLPNNNNNASLSSSVSEPPKSYTGIIVGGQPVYKQPPPPFHDPNNEPSSSPSNNKSSPPSVVHNPRPTTTKFFDGAVAALAQVAMTNSNASEESKPSANNNAIKKDAPIISKPDASSKFQLPSKQTSVSEKASLKSPPQVPVKPTNTDTQTSIASSSKANINNASGIKSNPTSKATNKTPSKTTTTATTTSPSKTSSSSSNENPFIQEDPKLIQQAVHSILHLLQTYGPLSYEQLKFNMMPQLVPAVTLAQTPQVVDKLDTLPPPKLGQLQGVVDKEEEEEKLKLQQQQKEGAENDKGKEEEESISSRPPKDKLQKVLDILFELGIIHLVDKSRLKQQQDAVSGVVGGGGEGEEGKINEGDSDEPPTEQAIREAYNDPNPIYCFGNGMPRMDVVLPSQVLHEIKLAGEEVLRMKLRVDLLRKALLAIGEEGKKEGEENDIVAVVGGENKEVQQQQLVAESAGGANETIGAAPTTATEKQPNPTKRPRRKQTPEQHAIKTLKRLYQLHPEIVNDPVYAAALKMFSINVGTKIDHHNILVENEAEVDMIIGKISGGDNAGNNSNSKNGVKGGGMSKKNSSDNVQRGLKRSASTDSGGGLKKKKRKGRPPKNSNSSDKLKGGSGSVGGEIPVVRTNASWV